MTKLILPIVDTTSRNINKEIASRYQHFHFVRVSIQLFDQKSFFYFAL